ncbi:MAG TPA: hypothetical protein VFI78_05270 [Salinimicrobium sp.]|nr:hypothetical protein [Salinimicrobium sp.]
MKTKHKDQKKEPARPAGGFDTVQTFRKIKDKISKDLKGMSSDEIKRYLKKESSKLQME